MQGGAVAPAFVLSQGGAKGLAGEVEATAFITKDVAPATGSRCITLGVAAKRKLTCAGDRDNAGRAGSSSERAMRPSCVTKVSSLGTSSFSRFSLSAGPPLKPAQSDLNCA